MKTMLTSMIAILLFFYLLNSIEKSQNSKEKIEILKNRAEIVSYISRCSIPPFFDPCIKTLDEIFNKKDIFEINSTTKECILKYCESKKYEVKELEIFSEFCYSWGCYENICYGWKCYERG